IGLGLAAVYGIIKQSDGHIHASSRPGGGTTFHLHLPVAERGAHPFDEDPFHLPGGCETILLVEAEATVRRMTKEVLERSGYQVLDAPDGRSAAALADADSQHVDLLIADVPAASAAGRDIVSRLRSSRPELRVLFTTADTEEHDAAKDHGDAKNHGAVAESVAVDGAAVAASPVLRKPFTMTALTQKVREILDAE
ncbi:MAG TPA: response regulator, partial [Pirellulales bacterium]